MSLILDALRKSDRERSRQASERLREGPLPARDRGFPAAALLIGVAALMLLAAGMLFVRSNASRTATGASKEIMENDTAAPPVAAVRDLGDELGAELDAAAPPPTESKPSAPSQEVAQTAPAVATEELRAPPLGALPAAVRERLPDLTVNVHAWAPEPANRFVLINLHRYGEGERTSEGPVVRRILRDGVVLEFEGNLFSLPRN